MRASIAGADAIRYFDIRGRSPNQLSRQMDKKADKYCSKHAAACVKTRYRVRPNFRTDPRTGECRITGVSTSLKATVFMPRWVRPSKAFPELVAWWRKVFDRIAWHEGQHIKIAERYVARIPGQLVGRKCIRFGPEMKRWSKRVKRAQKTFDKRDYKRPWPAYHGPWP